MSPTPEITANPERFSHLHLHSVYSLLDGAIQLEDLVKQVKSLGMKSVAVTDHGNMFGTIDFYEAAVKEGIKPIIGCEVYVAGGSRFDKKQEVKIADGGNYHLVLLAKNKDGYKNLIKLSSKAYTEGFYKKPRIDYELLAQYSDGLIATTACLGGEVNRRLMEGENQKAYDLACHLNEIMGKGNFFLEIQNHNIPEQVIAAKGSVEISKKTGIPLVLTNDAHFLRRQDQKAQDIMLRIQMNKQIDEDLGFGFNEEFYVKSPAEMRRLFPELPEAFHNTALIEDMVDLQMDFGHPLLPNFTAPQGVPLSQYLSQNAFSGLQIFFNGNPIPPKYAERLNYELDVIKSMGFESYFLIVADFINFAKSRGIPVGPGRGSAAGSLVAMSLGITNIDPIRYDLLFERFLNPSRKEMPDIDIDFCRDRREEVYDYVVQKYGADHVSQIITFGTLSAKAVIKDVARVLGFPYSDINALSKHLPDTPGIKLKDAIAASPVVQEFLQRGEKEKLLRQVAEVLEGVPRNAGKHAAGVVIGPQPLDEIIPLAYDVKSGSIITQFDKSPLEKAGLVKMDFLGLKNLTIIQNCLDEIELRNHIKIDINKIPLDDADSYRLLQTGETKGIFQVEKSGITNLLREARPKTFEDIVACIALYRPGPLSSGMTQDYVKRKNGQAKVEYPHKNLEAVLKDTFGTVVYQEQVMLISQIVGGFSMAKADNLRKAMGKKKPEIIQKLKEEFVDGAVGQGYDKVWAEKLYDQLGEFAAYGFNKSHSAAYGLITYQTAYLKAHYPIEFMKASLDADIETTDKLIGFLHETRRMGIAVLPPDVNESNSLFTIIDKKIIRYGLLGIKGLGYNVVAAIVQERNDNGRFSSVADFASRVSSQFINKKSMEALIFAGAFDSLQHSRSSLFKSLNELLQFGSKISQDRQNGQDSLFGVAEQNENFQIENLAEWPENEKLALEKKSLGLYLSSHPLQEFEKILPHTDILPISEIDDGVSSERNLEIIGVIEKIEFSKNVRGTSFTSLLLSDLSGRIDVRVFTNLYQQVSELLVENSRVLVRVKAAIFRDRDNPLLFVTASQIEPAEKITQRVHKSLHIRLPEENESIISKTVEEIKNILLKNKGNSAVYFYAKDEENKRNAFRAHPSFNVEYSKDVTDLLTTILPPEAIAWQIGDKLEFVAQQRGR